MVSTLLSAIIINYRSSPLADAAVRSLLSGSMVPDEIVLIDNEGTDGGLSTAIRSMPNVRLVARSENPGYSASCNTGAAAAQGDTLLFLNADVTLDPDCLRRIAHVLAADPGVGIVTARLVRPDGSIDHACHRGLPTAASSLAYLLRLHRLAPRSRQLGGYTMSWLDPLTEHDVEACSGAFMLMPRSVLDTVGGWDERYRFYAEDLDLCLRVRDHGWRVRYVGDAVATHVKGAFSLRDVPDAALTPEQRQHRLTVRRHVLASHRLFYSQYLEEEALWPMRKAAELLFQLQERRLSQAERRAARA